MRPTFGYLVKTAGSTLLVFPILLGMLAWHAYFPVQHLADMNWTLCGTFTFNCASKPCLILLDQRKRAIIDECTVLDDDSGYKHLKAPHWWTYKPLSVALQCDNRAVPSVRIDSPMFQATCEGNTELR